MSLKNFKNLIKLWQTMEMELRNRTLLSNFYLWIGYSYSVAEFLYALI